MKTAVLALAFAASLTAANEPRTFRGTITDTMCGKTHGMVTGQSDEKCISMCLKGSSRYALFDGNSILHLTDQKLPAKYAAQRVRVTGTLDEKTHTIRVRTIEPDTDTK
jgi:hypothetical protein